MFPKQCFFITRAHIVQELLQVLLQLIEVDGGDEAFARFGQAVSGQLGELVVNEAEDPVGERQHVLGRVSLDEISQAFLHLCRGLETTHKQSLQAIEWGFVITK